MLTVDVGWRPLGISSRNGNLIQTEMENKIFCFRWFGNLFISFARCSFHCFHLIVWKKEPAFGFYAKNAGHISAMDRIDDSNRKETNICFSQLSFIWFLHRHHTHTHEQYVFVFVVVLYKMCCICFTVISDGFGYCSVTSADSAQSIREHRCNSIVLLLEWIESSSYVFHGKTCAFDTNSELLLSNRTEYGRAMWPLWLLLTIPCCDFGQKILLLKSKLK